MSQDEIAAEMSQRQYEIRLRHVEQGIVYLYGYVTACHRILEFAKTSLPKEQFDSFRKKVLEEIFENEVAEQTNWFYDLANW